VLKQLDKFKGIANTDIQNGSTIMLSLLQKTFVVSVENPFLMSAAKNDTF
jgi:hypothetical protein